MIINNWFSLLSPLFIYLLIFSLIASLKLALAIYIDFNYPFFKNKKKKNKTSNFPTL